MQNGDTGKSPINEIEKLRVAVLLPCDLQKELAQKVDGALKGRSIKTQAATWASFSVRLVWSSLLAAHGMSKWAGYAVEYPVCAAS